MKHLATLIAGLALGVTCAGQTKFENAGFGFEASVPADWHTYSEVRDDGRGGSIIDWGLPKVWSLLEKDSIENAVVIMAYRRPEITNLESLQEFELRRVKPILISKETLNTGKAPTLVTNSERGKRRYKGQTRFFFKNGIGYVVTFTATPGTYDVNVNRFEKFAETLRFKAPERPATAVSAESKLQLDRIYMAKTGTLDLDGTPADIYNYLRFTPSGEVYTQSVTSNDAEAVGKWFGPQGRWERKGRYSLDGTKISFDVNNNGTEDIAVEGPRTDRFAGKVFDNGKLYLTISFNGGPLQAFWFESAKP